METLSVTKTCSLSRDCSVVDIGCRNIDKESNVRVSICWYLEIIVSVQSPNNAKTNPCFRKFVIYFLIQLSPFQNITRFVKKHKVQLMFNFSRRLFYFKLNVIFKYQLHVKGLVSLLGHLSSAPVVEVPYDYILCLPPIVFWVNTRLSRCQISLSKYDQGYKIFIFIANNYSRYLCLSSSDIPTCTFSVVAPTLWNTLPADIRNGHSFKI